jgi:energy-coupling factor transport system ATP-binding protein
MPPEAIAIDHLTFTYDGETTPALRDISLRVAAGEMIVVMGATGAGKSTLSKVLNRSIPAFQAGRLQGSISIFGKQLENETVGDLAGTVALVTQDFEAQLFATNVLQEVAFGLEQFGVAAVEIRRRALDALEAVGLEGFDGRDPATLSGGEKQRLAIAATLALEPRILVFDEPTTDLDPLGKLEIFELLGSMRTRGYTLVVFEHETAAAEHADRLLLMRHGEIAAEDEPNRLFAQPETLARYGVRPTDLGRVAERLGIAEPLLTVEDAAAAIARRHLTTNPAAMPPAAAPASHTSILIEVENIEHHYDRDHVVLRGVSMRIEPGEMIALIGQNGSGKTTLAKHLNGLLRPTAGRVLLRGEDVGTLPLDRVAATVGYVFQNPDHQIFAATILDEIGFGPRNLGLGEAAIRDRVHDALAAVGLSGLDAEDPFLLSKGHRQRLAVASLLALRPELLILDEPTTGLDYDEQRHMMDLLGRLNADGMAVLIITHSPWVVAEYARRGVLMKAGKILFDGHLRALFAREDLLADARFCPPDVTRLGGRFGFTPLSVQEFVAGIAARQGETG